VNMTHIADYGYTISQHHHNHQLKQYHTLSTMSSLTAIQPT
jgi:hypothetical protein